MLSSDEQIFAVNIEEHLDRLIELGARPQNGSYFDATEVPGLLLSQLDHRPVTNPAEGESNDSQLMSELVEAEEQRDKYYDEMQYLQTDLDAAEKRIQKLDKKLAQRQADLAQIEQLKKEKKNLEKLYRIGRQQDQHTKEYVKRLREDLEESRQQKKYDKMKQERNTLQGQLDALKADLERSSGVCCRIRM